MPVAASLPAARAVRRRRAAQAALAGFALLCCTAAGFATGRMWDGRDIDSMTFRAAVDAARDPYREPSSRRAALAQVVHFTYQGAQLLGESRRDPVLAVDATAVIQRMQAVLGQD
jgi:hypothetical protein